MVGSRKFRRGGGGPDNVIKVFHRGLRTEGRAYGEAIEPTGSKCFSRGSVPEFQRTHIDTCDFAPLLWIRTCINTFHSRSGF